MRETDLFSLVQSAVDSIRPTAKTKNIEIVSELQDGMTRVLADPDRLRQVVWNLLTNAVKFTPACGRVKIGLSKLPRHIELRVSDNGQGIAPEFVPHMFEAFRQHDSSTTRRAGGLGLGLAIVKQLVELHGGYIAAYSDGLGKGATFIVQLPLDSVAETEVKAQHTNISKSPTLWRGLANLTVLIVEDQPDSLAAIATLLRGEGATVLEATSASIALDILKQQQPSILLSDIGMPEMNGLEFIKRVRSDEAARHSARLPAVALTAFTREEDKQTAIESGFDRFLEKPFEPDALINCIRSMLNNNVKE